MSNGILKAIELGKIWMKKSIDPTHDYNHAKNVEKHAIEIFRELKPKGLTEEIVKLAVWWHDAYKSRCKTVTFDSIWNEGRKSAAIFQEEVGPLLDFKTMAKVSKAIVTHNRATYAMINKRHLDDLSLILIEADQLDGLNYVRVKREEKYIKNPFVLLVDRLLTAFVPFFLLRIHRSRYGRDKLRNFVLRK